MKHIYPVGLALIALITLILFSVWPQNFGINIIICIIITGAFTSWVIKTEENEC